MRSRFSGQVIDEQFAVQMIDFVLNTRQRPSQSISNGSPGAVQAHRITFGTADGLVNARNRQAALVHHLEPLQLNISG